MTFLPRDHQLLPRFHISRPRLLRQLGQAVQGKLTLVCANAGYGKTTLLTEFVHQGSLRVEWYHFTTADRDIVHLFEGLEGVFRRLSPEDETKGAWRPRARQAEEHSVSGLTDALIRLATRVSPDPTLLVLDDYQIVDRQGDMNALLGPLIENSPPCLHYVILSRSAPRFSLARLMARQELVTLSEDDLSFAKEETGDLLRGKCEFALDDEAIDLVHQRTEGWAAAIAMVAQSLRVSRPERVMAILADPAASVWLVYDYLAQEVFDRLEPQVQDFLIRTSILNRMSPEACDYLLSEDSSVVRLLALEAQCLFIYCLDPLKRSYKYHQLFAEFLRQKLRQQESGITLSGLHGRAAQYWEREEQWEECVHHYLEAGVPLKAAEVIERIGERFIFSGFSKTVEHWLKLLPEEVVTTRPWLMAFRGRLNHLSVHHEEALRVLERAHQLFHENGDAKGQAWTAGEIAYVEYRSINLDRSIRRFASALEREGTGSWLRSHLLVMYAMVLRDAGRLTESIDSCTASLKELSGVDDEGRRIWEQSRALRNLGMAQMEAGQLGAALASAREALAIEEENQIGEYEESWCLSQLGAILTVSGQTEAATSALNRAFSLAGRHVRHIQHFVGLWLGNCLRDCGRYEEAEQAYAQSIRMADMENVYLSILSHRLRGPSPAALDVVRQYQNSEAVALRSTAEVVLGVLWRAGHKPERALTHIKQAVEIFMTHGYPIRAASALLHQARLEYEIANPVAARESLNHVFEIASKGQYFHFFWWDPELIAFLCQKALVEGVFPDYAAELAARRLDASSGRTLAPLLHHHRLEVRQRALSLLRSLPDRGDESVHAHVLAGCTEPGVRDFLRRAMEEGLLSTQGVQLLRTRNHLTWREIQVLVEYYLRPTSEPVCDGTRLRAECARRLNLSENTVRCHVNNLRTKLELPAWVSGKRFLDWAEQQRLVPRYPPSNY